MLKAIYIVILLIYIQEIIVKTLFANMLFSDPLSVIMYKYIRIEELLESKSYYDIAYKEWGNPENNNVLLCVHGILRNCRDFDYLAQSFSDIYRVICIDIVGRGNSSWLENSRNYDNTFYVRGIIKLLNVLNINQVDWIGSSLGGILGIITAKKQNTLIRKLVLNDIGAFMNGNHLKGVYKLLTNSYAFTSREESEAYLRRILSEFGINNEELWQQIFSSSIIKEEEVYRYNYDKNIYENMKKRIEGKSSDVNLWDLWKEINCNTLILRGSRSQYLTQEVLEMMIAGKDNVVYKIYEGIGHTPSLMYYNQIKDIRDFLLS